jgi:hypothetical protein
MRRPWSWDEPEASAGGPHQPAAGPKGRLSREAVRLLLSLGLACDVPCLATQYPHVLNRLAEVWDQCEETERYLNELLLAHRDNRKGFDLPALQELVALAERHRRRLPPSNRADAGRREITWRG